MSETPRRSPTSLRQAAALLLVFAGLSSAAHPARADTVLQDPAGVLRIEAPGRWRQQETEHAITATGFLGGIKRAEMYAVIYEGVAQDTVAATRWKSWRTGKGGDPAYTYHAGDATRWIAAASGAKEIEYVRALAADGRSAIVWVRVSGAAGEMDEAAFDLLAKWAFVAKPPPGSGDGEPGGEDQREVVRLKDQRLRLEVSLPAGWELRREVPPVGGRVLSATGPIGTDPEAYLDVYSFDAFERAPAAALWWRESERRGWQQPITFEGDGENFRMLVQGETWTRHVRVVHSSAGVLGVLLDAESKVDEAAIKFVDGLLLDGLEVLKPLPKEPQAPPGFATLAGRQLTMFHAGSAVAAKAILAEAESVNAIVEELLGLEPWEGRSAVLRVYAAGEALEAALRPLGIADGEAAYWRSDERVVVTHLEAVAGYGPRARLREELTREALQRRFGYRPPYWLERGVALVVASAAHQRGRIDLAHPKHIEGARNAAGGSVEFESVRWWTEEQSVGNPERDAISWSFALLFVRGGAVGKKWEPMFRSYVAELHATGDPATASKAFDFARDAELVDDWKKWVRKL